MFPVQARAAKVGQGTIDLLVRNFDAFQTSNLPYRGRPYS